jgi:acyl-CoA synthetase (AMP-forming)/AMP-acid ligase II
MLCINYGTNEAGPVTRMSPTFLARHPDSIGCVTPETEVMICADDGTPAEPGIPGSIKVRGGSVVEGYFQDETATAANFGDGWFDTGDIGYLTADGALYLLGRNDDMMIFNGFNIHPSEIERFMEQHPCVSEVAAVSVKSDLHGDIPVAFVVRKRECTEAELIAACDERLGIKAPRRVFFVKDLPRNAAGKVLRRELAQRLHAK